MRTSADTVHDFSWKLEFFKYLKSDTIPECMSFLFTEHDRTSF